MKFKNVLLTTFFSVCTALSWGQQNSIPYLYLQKNGGQVLEILFADSEIRLQDDEILVDTPPEQYRFGYDEVDSFWFLLKAETKIEEIQTPALSIQVYLDDAGILHVSGNHPLGDVAIYNMIGNLMKKTATNATEITMDISGFAKGIYLVKTNEKTVKIIK